MLKENSCASTELRLEAKDKVRSTYFSELFDDL